MFLSGTFAGKLGDRFGAAIVGPISLFAYVAILVQLRLLISDIGICGQAISCSLLPACL